MHTFEQILSCAPCDLFAYLGRHERDGAVAVRCFAPGADEVVLVDRAGKPCMKCARTHADGLFEANAAAGSVPLDYRLSVRTGDDRDLREDPYRFPSQLRPEDAWLFAEGRHERPWRFLGARAIEVESVVGVQFAVWAPNATRVAVLGDFNHYDSRTHVMRFHPGCGIWEMFVPGPRAGARYRFEVTRSDGRRVAKIDPYARAFGDPSDPVAIVVEDAFSWGDETWLARRRAADARTAPLAIYEVHAGSWKRDEHGAPLDYTALARELVDYACEMGFTHIEFLPLTEHPFTGSWGYQPTGLYAPTARYGSPGMLKRLVDTAHRRGIGVLLDWVPAHFPADEYALAEYDGTHLYEHADRRRGVHPDWNTLIYNYGRAEVIDFLVGSALYWIEEFHIDGLRVDAVASMLYLDYSREPGEWVPNRDGGRENLEAVDLIRRVTQAVARHQPGAMVIAEESTAWPGVTAQAEAGGLGFTFKWNMGWMHDTLRYLQSDPVYRSHHHNEITFSMVYAYSERFLLPLSHDEVVHGKGSLLGKMAGDRWQQFATLRLCLAYMWAHPGKKLLFMGGEIGALREWNHDGTVDWALLGDAEHAGVQRLVCDLNRLLRTRPALHAADDRPEGFAWCIVDDAQQSVLAFERRAADAESVIVACNFTPVPRSDYLLPVEERGQYVELLNTDSAYYGGSNLGNQGRVETLITRDGAALPVTLPPLAAVMFARRSR